VRSKYISDAYVKLLEGQLKREEWLPLEVARQTGLRIGDVVALRRSDLEGNTIHFVAQKTNKAGSAVISAELSAELRSRRNRRSKWLFPSPKNPREHLTRQACWARVKKACERLGVPPDGVSPHSMRKAYAVELYKREGLQAASRALQHDRAATTELYVMSDYLSPDNENRPILRKDFDTLVRFIYQAVKMALDNGGEM
jgi:integrase